MSTSMNLITAHIAFLTTRVVLVHIPKEHYAFFLQPLLRILFGENHATSDTPWSQQHEFLNLSLTQIGCSLICSEAAVSKWLTPMVDHFNNILSQSKSPQNLIEISHEEYVVIQVDGQGLNASERVLELTAPLAMAGISLFFITTYFSDYILVPSRARQTVLTTLQQHGFVFSPEAEAYVSQLSPTFTQATTSPNRPATSSSSGSEHFRPHSLSMPSTPPAKDVPELQVRTFTKLSKNKIEPTVDPSLRLVSCAAARESTSEDLEILKSDLIQILLATNAYTPKEQKPQRTNGLRLQNIAEPLEDVSELEPDISARFLSITLTEEEPVSILLEERLLLDSRIGRTLLTSRDEDEIMLPIILDLRPLGWRATGIVGGVAGRLAQGSAPLINRFRLDETGDSQGMSRARNEPMEISFLSSAKAGSVIVRAAQLSEALQALEMGMREVRDLKG